MSEGAIAPGVVDERDIRDVLPHELKEYTQCHFFAGIGVWSHSLRKAGFSDDDRVWTGSCPCQPFSAAGRRAGVSDERHLWPHWNHLIQENQPPIIFGEQVASKDGINWFDLVSSDLEGQKYSVGAADLCAAGFGAPHIRQRLFFGAYSRRDNYFRVADSKRFRRERGERPEERGFRHRQDARWPESDNGLVGPNETYSRGLGDSVNSTREWDPRGFLGEKSEEHGEGFPIHGGKSFRLEYAGPGLDEKSGTATSGFWRNTDWLLGQDPDQRRFRPVEPGSFPLADGTPNRVGRVRAYGNAIVSEVAAGFIGAFMEASIMDYELSLNEEDVL